MYRLAFASGLLLAVTAGAAADSWSTTPSCAAGERCGGYYDQERVQREGLEQRAALQRVLAILASGEAAPEADARSAAAAGNFRLIWSSGFGFLSVAGGHCRFPLSNPETRRAPFTLFEVGFTDVVQDCEGRDRAACDTSRRLADYAVRYNRTLRADPRFPYADLCAVQVETRRLRGLPGLHQPESLAPPARVETDAPRNLGEAVRRGTLPALRHMLAGIGPAVLDRRDDFSLTPLAWALIDNRPDVARLLLAHGADPLGGCAAPWGEMEAMPLGIALLKGQRALVDAMLTPAVRARLRPWPPALVLLAARGNHEALLREMLATRPDVNVALLLDAAVTSGSPALRQHIARSSLEAKAAFLELAVRRGEPALIREAIALGAPLRPGLNDRHSYLGSAVTNPTESMDVTVGLLLAAGAAPDSPADFSRNGYPTGSTPPTALVALVAVADRIHPGMAGRIEPEYARRMAAQRRTLDLLLTAHASVRATDSYDRPLAVLALTGQYDPRGVNMRAELPEGWLTRLAQAGMDVNATWLGSTALDWADALGMADTSTARELVRLGGRRLKRADLSGGSRF